MAQTDETDFKRVKLEPNDSNFTFMDTSMACFCGKCNKKITKGTSRIWDNAFVSSTQVRKPICLDCAMSNGFVRSNVAEEPNHAVLALLQNIERRLDAIENDIKRIGLGVTVHPDSVIKPGPILSRL